MQYDTQGEQYLASTCEAHSTSNSGQADTATPSGGDADTSTPSAGVADTATPPGGDAVNSRLVNVTKLCGHVPSG